MQRSSHGFRCNINPLSLLQLVGSLAIPLITLGYVQCNPWLGYGLINRRGRGAPLVFERVLTVLSSLMIGPRVISEVYP
jgi:hypothetical protein